MSDSFKTSTICIPGEPEKRTLEVINVVVSTLSLIGSLLTIISYLNRRIRKHFETKAYSRSQQPSINGDNVFHNNLSSPSGSSIYPSTPQGHSSTKPAAASSKLPDLIFMLAISDFFTSVMIIFSQAYLMRNYSSYIEETTLKFNLEFSPCIILRGFIQFFFLSTFLWTTCISYYLYQQLSSPNREKYIMYIFAAISWGVPLIIVLGLALSNSFQLDPSTGWCESGQKFEFIFWFLPLFLCVLFCAIYYIRLRRLFRIKFEYRLQVNERLKQLDNTISRRLTLYIVVFLICWIPDIIQHLVSYTGCAFFPLMVVSNLLSPAQGFLNLLVYSISNKVVQAPSLSETKRLLGNSI